MVISLVFKKHKNPVETLKIAFMEKRDLLYIGYYSVVRNIYNLSLFNYNLVCEERK